MIMRIFHLPGYVKIVFDRGSTPAGRFSQTYLFVEGKGEKVHALSLNQRRRKDWEGLSMP
jgi:hypothetical protein